MTHQPPIERLQAAESGSRELDEAMALACGWACGWRRDVPPLTTSLDAVLDEIERVFPKRYYELSCSPQWYFSGHIYRVKLGGKIAGTHKSAPLAACIALLRAIEARDNGEVK